MNCTEPLPRFPPGPHPRLQYRVTATVVSQQRLMSGAPLLWSFNTGGCVTLDGLASGVEYRFTTEAFSRAWGGASASVNATPN